MDYNFGLMSGELTVAVGALVLLVHDAIRGEDSRFDPRPQRLYTWVAAISCLFAACLVAGVAGLGTSFGGLFIADAFARWFKVAVLIGGALGIMLADDWLTNHRLGAAPAHSLVLLSTAGMMYAISAGDLVTAFLGIEVMSIPIYALAGALRWNDGSVESGVKYLVLGSFAAAVMLFGMALLYGWTGLAGGEPTLQIEALRATLMGGLDAPIWAVAGAVLLLVGLLFKVGAAPFHMWTPDVYEGAPTPITAWMSVAVKATAIALVLRIFGGERILYALHLEQVLWGIAALTMIVGNVMALAQQNIKRMLAYSSIAHGGYMLLGVLAGTPDGQAGILYYAVAYTFGNVAAFGALLYLSRQGHAVERFSDLDGLGARHPVVGGVMSIAMLSLMGIPPLAGFFGKFKVFMAAVAADYVGLAIVGVLASAVSVAYYLRPMVSMFMGPEPLDPVEVPSGRTPLVVAVALAVAGTLLLGFFPSGALDMAAASALQANR